MKKLILALFLSVSLIQSIAQITDIDKSTEPTIIGRAGDSFSTIATMYKIAGDTDFYYITFNNMKYQMLTDIKSFGFLDVDGAYNHLFNSVVKASKEKRKEVSFKLQDGTLTFELTRVLGVVNIQLNWYEKGVLSYSGFIVPKKFTKLFGKTYIKTDWK